MDYIKNIDLLLAAAAAAAEAAAAEDVEDDSNSTVTANDSINASLSFLNVPCSTPIKLRLDPPQSVPLNLSTSAIDESPLNLTGFDENDDPGLPLNLIKTRDPRIEASVGACALNLIMNKKPKNDVQENLFLDPCPSQRSQPIQLGSGPVPSSSRNHPATPPVSTAALFEHCTTESRISQSITPSPSSCSSWRSQPILKRQPMQLNSDSRPSQRSQPMQHGSGPVPSSSGNHPATPPVSTAALFEHCRTESWILQSVTPSPSSCSSWRSQPILKRQPMQLDSDPRPSHRSQPMQHGSGPVPSSSGNHPATPPVSTAALFEHCTTESRISQSVTPSPSSCSSWRSQPILKRQPMQLDSDPRPSHRSQPMQHGSGPVPSSSGNHPATPPVSTAALFEHCTTESRISQSVTPSPSSCSSWLSVSLSHGHAVHSRSSQLPISSDRVITSPNGENLLDTPSGSSRLSWQSPTSSKRGSQPRHPLVELNSSNLNKLEVATGQYRSSNHEHIDENNNADTKAGEIDDINGDESDDDDVQIGDTTLLNDFSIREYFEPYFNHSLIAFDDEKPVADEEAVDPSSDNHEQPEDAYGETVAKKARTSIDAPDAADNRVIDDLRESETKKSKALTRESLKLLKQKGHAFTRPNGTRVPARKVKDPCRCIKLKCHSKYDYSMRKKLLRNLLKLTSSAQNQFIANHVDVSYAASSKVLNSRRLYTHKYYLPGVGGMVRVCKMMFLTTLDITEKKVRVLSKKKVKGSGIVADDQRCNNLNRNPITEEVKKYVVDHISSFPRYTSHYNREKSAKMYLDSNLNITKLYDLYCIKCKQDSLNPISFNSYRMIFRGLNYSFKKPKVDTCNECDKLQVALKNAKKDEDISELQAAQSMHQQRAKRVYDMKREDVQSSKTDHSICTASFDLQKCLPTPHLTCGQAYYSRQLYTLNLTFFESYRGKNTATCYLWDETKGRRGSQEIGSCLFEFISSLMNDGSPKTIILYSDRCSGQNHNFIICMVLSYVMEKLAAEGRQLVIIHKFMATGHSHMEVDSVHAAIERAKKVNNINIETPREWAVFIAQIKRRIPFTVKELNLPDFLGWKSLQQRYKKPNVDNVGERWRFKNVMVFEYNTERLGEIYFKYEPEETEYRSVRISNALQLPLPTIDPLNTEPIQLTKQKLEDLKALLPFLSNKNYYETFLKSLQPSKRGRKKLAEAYHFDDDMDFSGEE